MSTRASRNKSPPAAPAVAARFTKIGSEGERLPADAPEWVAVHDAQTGLIWSRTLSDRPVRQSKAVEIAADLDLLAEEDWQLPTRAQLNTLVDDTRVNPAIDVDFFPNCRPGWYWTRTPLASSPSGYAWNVYFCSGDSYWGLQYYEGFVRAVRPGQ